MLPYQITSFTSTEFPHIQLFEFASNSFLTTCNTCTDPSLHIIISIFQLHLSLQVYRCIEINPFSIILMWSLSCTDQFPLAMKYQPVFEHWVCRKFTVWQLCKIHFHPGIPTWESFEKCQRQWVSKTETVPPVVRVLQRYASWIFTKRSLLGPFKHFNLINNQTGVEKAEANDIITTHCRRKSH